MISPQKRKRLDNDALHQPQLISAEANSYEVAEEAASNDWNDEQHEELAQYSGKIDQPLPAVEVAKPQLNQQIRFRKVYEHMRAFETSELLKEGDTNIGLFADEGIQTAAPEECVSGKLPNRLVGLPSELFCFFWPEEELASESIEIGRYAASQQHPTTKLLVVDYECILDVLKQLTADASCVHSNFRLPALENPGICHWEDTELALDASWNWCKSTLFTALHILKAHKVDPETHFWLVVATMLLNALRAEEMLPVLDWADRKAVQYHQVWPGAIHELPSLLYLLLWEADGKDAAFSDGIRAELVRTIDQLEYYHRGHLHETSESTVATETSEQRAILNLNFGNGSAVVNVVAYAGTGKTASAIGQQRNVGGNCLMLFYNKSAQEDAEKRLEADGQDHVKVKTMDALIWSHTNQATGRSDHASIVNVSAELIKDALPHLLPKVAAGISRLLKRFLFSDKYSLSDRSFDWDVMNLDREWNTWKISKKGKPTKYADQSRPEWVKSAGACLDFFTSAKFFREKLCFELLTKLVQLKTRIYDEQMKGRDPALVEPATISLLKRTKIKPLFFATLTPNPTQVVIDEGMQVCCITKLFECICGTHTFLHVHSRNLIQLVLSSRFKCGAI